MNTTIAMATKHDCRALGLLNNVMFRESLGILHMPGWLSNFLMKFYSVWCFRRSLRRGDVILVLRYEDQVVGYLQLGKMKLPLEHFDHRSQIEIQRVYIDPSFRHRGMARKLFKHLQEYPQLHGANEIYLGVDEGNVVAVRFYKQCGYKPVGQYRLQSGLQGLYYNRQMIMRRSYG